jgi:hypothetical protein
MKALSRAMKIALLTLCISAGALMTLQAQTAEDPGDSIQEHNCDYMLVYRVTPNNPHLYEIVGSYL